MKRKRRREEKKRGTEGRYNKKRAIRYTNELSQDTMKRKRRREEKKKEGKGEETE